MKAYLSVLLLVSSSVFAHEQGNTVPGSSVSESTSVSYANASVTNSINTRGSGSESVNVKNEASPPSVGAGSSVSSGTCYAASSVGGGGSFMSILLPFMKEDEQCTYRANIATVGEYDQASAQKMLCNLKGYAEASGKCSSVVAKSNSIYKPF